MRAIDRAIKICDEDKVYNIRYIDAKNSSRPTEAYFKADSEADAKRKFNSKIDNVKKIVWVKEVSPSSLGYKNALKHAFDTSLTLKQIHNMGLNDKKLEKVLIENGYSKTDYLNYLKHIR